MKSRDFSSFCARKESSGIGWATGVCTGAAETAVLGAAISEIGASDAETSGINAAAEEISSPGRLSKLFPPPDPGVVGVSGGVG